MQLYFILILDHVKKGLILILQNLKTFKMSHKLDSLLTCPIFYDIVDAD
jgi:hypothetical protein